jgi:hypothetical protein
MPPSRRGAAERTCDAHATVCSSGVVGSRPWPARSMSATATSCSSTRVELYYARVERAGPRDVVVQPLDPADRRPAGAPDGDQARLPRRRRARHRAVPPTAAPSAAAPRRHRRAPALMRVGVIAEASRARRRAAGGGGGSGRCGRRGPVVGRRPRRVTSRPRQVDAYGTVAVTGNDNQGVTGERRRRRALRSADR